MIYNVIGSNNLLCDLTSYAHKLICDGSDVLDDTVAQWLKIDLGVPQESILGPLLYIIFTVDITLVLGKHSSLVIFMLTAYMALLLTRSYWSSGSSHSVLIFIVGCCQIIFA